MDCGAGPDEVQATVFFDMPSQASAVEVQRWLRLDRGTWQSDLLARLTAPQIWNASTQRSMDKMSELNFGFRARNVASLQSEALLCGMNRRRYPDMALSYLALTFFLMIMCTEALARWIHSSISAGIFEGVIALVWLSNDETCMYMCMPQDISPELLAGFRKVESKYKGQAYARYLCKVMNIIAKVVIMLKIPGTDGSEPFIYLLELPDHLYNMDHNTGETTRECWKRLRNNFPWVFKLVDSFLRVGILHTNDNGIQNIRWFAAEIRDRLPSALPLRSCCDVHAAHTGFGHALDSAKWVFSGVTNTSLAFSSPNALESFKRGVRLLGKVRIKVTKCARVPSLSRAAQQYKTAVVQSFFRPAIHGNQGLIRSFILLGFLNGDWRDEEWIVHWCIAGCCCDKSFQETFDRIVVDSLLPFVCPTCRRGRWLGALKPVDWQGPIFCIHGIGALVVPPWARELGNSARPMREEDFKHASSGLLRMLVGRIEDAEPALPQLCDESVLEEALAVVEQAAAANNVDLNEQHRMGAEAFAKLRPAPWLIMVRTAMIPFVGLLDVLLRMAGARWDRKQANAAREGNPVKLRLVECAKGAVTSAFFIQVRGFLFGNWFWEKIPSGYRHERMASNAFRFVIRGAASIFWNIWFPRTRRFPTRIFRLLDPDITAEEEDEICNAKSCLWDDFVVAFRAWFITKVQLLSALAKAVLRLIAWIMRNETVLIEDMHASLRRYILRAIQTKSRAFHQILADYAAMRLRLRYVDYVDVAQQSRAITQANAFTKKQRPSVRKKPLSHTQNAIRLRNRRAAKRKPRGKRPSIVSPWNIFCGHKRATIIGPISRPEMLALSREFRSLDRGALEGLRAGARAATTKRRAASFLGLGKSNKRARRMITVPEHKPDSIIFVHQSEYEKAAMHLTESSILEHSSAVGAARSMSETVAKQRRAAQAKERSALIRWQRDPPRAALRGEMAKLTTSSFLRMPFSDAAVKFNPNIVPLASFLAARLPEEMKEATVIKEWKSFSAMIEHMDCVPLGDIPRTAAQNWCCVAARCLCPGGPDPYLLRIQQAFSSKLRSLAPAKQRMRSLLSGGELVARILSSDKREPLWFHISYINLTTFVCVFLRCGLLANERLQAKVSPGKVVEVVSSRFFTVWDGLETLHYLLDHYVELWRIQAEIAVEDPSTQVAHLRLLCVEEAVLFWKGPRPRGAGGGGPKPKPGPDPHAPRHPPGAVSGGAPALAIEDCPAEAEVEDGPSAPVIGCGDIIEEAQAHLPDPIAEPLEDLAPGTPALNSPPQAKPEPKPAPPKAPPDTLAPPKAPPKKDAKPKLALFGGAKKGWAHPRDRSVCPDSDPVMCKVSGEHRGRIQRWEKDQSLIFICAVCETHFSRKYEQRKGPRPERYPQGRPMGFLIAAAQHKCGGNPITHRSAVACLSHEARLTGRQWAMALGLFGKSFALERSAWEYEGLEPIPSLG